MHTPRMNLRHDIAAMVLAPYLARLLSHRDKRGSNGPHEYRITLASATKGEPRFNVAVHDAKGNRSHISLNRTLPDALEAISDQLAIIDPPSAPRVPRRPTPPRKSLTPT